MPRVPRSEWVVVAGLLALGFIPALFGTARLVELASEAEITASNARFFAAPMPVVMHILAVIPYSSSALSSSLPASAVAIGVGTAPWDGSSRRSG